MKAKFLSAVLLSVLAAACSDDAPQESPETPPVVNPPSPGDALVLSTEGEAKDVQVTIHSPWRAESSASWCQLSDMGGDGGERVQVVAAYNTTGKSRTAVIRMYAVGQGGRGVSRSDSLSASQVITVEQPAGQGGEMPVCFTDIYLDKGKIWFTIYNGRNSSGSYQELTEVGGYDMLLNAPYTGSGRPPKYPPVYVKSGEYKTVAPYIEWNETGVMKGKFAISGEPAVNTLVVKQEKMFGRYADLGNEGSASVHFTGNGKIYYGGGIVKADDLAGADLGQGNAVTTLDFHCYDVEKRQEERLPDLPGSEGCGFVWNGDLFVLTGRTLYVLQDEAWKSVGQLPDETYYGAEVQQDKVSFVAASQVATYRISRTGSTSLPVLSDRKLYAHGQDLGKGTAYTTDESGRLWLFNEEARSFYALEEDKLSATMLPLDSLTGGVSLVGVDQGWVYIKTDQGMMRSSRDQVTESLQLYMTEPMDGVCENVDGTIYSFGGTRAGAAGGIWYSKQEFSSFAPSKYRPVSLTILPE